MSYTTISKNILKLNGLNAVYIYSLIKKYEDYKEHVSTLTEESIVKFSGVSKAEVKRTISDFKALNDTQLFSAINTVREGKKTRNNYSFCHFMKDFFYVDNKFYIDPLKGIDDKNQTKCKSLLLCIKALCINNTNVCKLNKVALSEKIGMDRKTLNKYLNMLIEAAQIKVLKEGYFIANENIIPDFLKDDEETEMYHSIYSFCLENKIIPPYRDFHINMNALAKEVNVSRLYKKSVKGMLSKPYMAKVLLNEDKISHNKKCSCMAILD